MSEAPFEHLHPDDAERIAVSCADCARSDSAADELTPVDHMPIPVEALAGFPDGVPQVTRHNRRNFLRNGAVGVAAVYGASRIDWMRAFEAGVAEGAPANSQLVMIFLNGGMDGLDVLIPHEAGEYAAYQTARPGLGRPIGPATGTASGSVALAGTGGAFGLATPVLAGANNNDATGGLDTLWGDGSGGVGSDLALFPAVDYTPPNLSHFDSRRYWFTGSLENEQTGWLGRWLDAYGSKENPLQAVSISGSVSRQIVTRGAPVAAIRGLGNVGFQLTGASSSQVDPTGEIGTLSGVLAAPANDALNRSRTSYGQTVDVARKVAGITQGAAPPGYPANNSLSQRLQTAAALLGAGIGTRIVTIDWGSFDTHGNQRAALDPQLRVLSAALAAFRDDLTARGIEQNVLTVVFSEFGRRIKENSSGTDHGAAGLVWVMGSAVRGGMRGDHPGVAKPDNRGNLQVTTDFRSVYQSLIAEWLGGDPGQILKGSPFPAISGALLG